MESNNYVSVGNIIEQERLKRQAQIAKGVSSDVYDHIEKAHQDDLSKGVEMTDNLSRFADDVRFLLVGEPCEVAGGQCLRAMDKQLCPVELCRLFCSYHAHQLLARPAE